MGEALALLSLVCFAVNIIITKMATTRLNISLGFFISVCVNIMFAALLFAIDYMIKGEIQPFHLKAFVLFLISGLFATFLGRWLFFETIERLGPAKASTFATSNPLFTVLISCVVLGETLSLPKWAAVAAVLIGLFLVSYVKPSPAEKEMAAALQTGSAWTTVRRTAFHPHFLFAISSSLCYAIGNILRGSAVQQWNEPILGAMIGAAVGLLLHVIFGMKLSTFMEQLRRANRYGIKLYVFSGVLTISGQILYIASMHFLPVSIATVINMSTPVLVLPISYFLLKNQEGISWRVILGAIMVLGGINVIILL